MNARKSGENVKRVVKAHQTISDASRTVIALGALILYPLLLVAARAETYQYDEHGRITKVTYDNNASIAYTYDKAGHILTRTTSSGVVQIPGDINNSGHVDAVDVQLVINAALGISINGLNADINNDHVVNAVDIQLVINAALGIPIK